MYTDYTRSQGQSSSAQQAPLYPDPYGGNGGSAPAMDRCMDQEPIGPSSPVPPVNRRLYEQNTGIAERTVQPPIHQHQVNEANTRGWLSLGFLVLGLIVVGSSIGVENLTDLAWLFLICFGLYKLMRCICC